MMLESIPSLLEGALSTLTVSFCGTILGMALGALAAIAAQSIAPLRWTVAIYVSFFRGTPLFIQILIIYYILPAIGIDVPRFGAGVIALGLNGGAHICEMIRGALTSIASGQIEAARALALSRFWIWARIILPQALVLILPPLTVEFTALLKGSALISVIGYVELTRTVTLLLATSNRPFALYLEAAALYFIMCFALASFTRYLQRSTVIYAL